VNDGERLGRERRLAAQRPALPRQATDKGADAGKGTPSFLPLCGGMWGWCMSVGMPRGLRNASGGNGEAKS